MAGRPGLRRKGEHPIESDAVDLIARLAAREGVHLADASRNRKLLGLLPKLFEQAQNPIRIHGRRAEEMFSYMVASLGAAKAVKREDAGEVVLRSTLRLAVPDFRIVLTRKHEILVEVKNFNHANPNKSIALTASYLRQMAAYGRLFDRQVYLAVYWARWRLWTLHPVSELLRAMSTENFHLSLVTALPRSHMYILGDATWGTTPPLTLRLNGAATQSKSSRKHFILTIREVTMLTAGRPIVSKRDQRLAWEFMLYGDWREEGPLPIRTDHEITGIEFTFRPIQAQTPECSMVAAASTLASAKFTTLTSDSRGIKQLRLSQLPMPAFPSAREKYFGSELRLWRFTIMPREASQ